MYYASGPLGRPELPNPASPLADGGRLLVIQNPHSGRADEANAHLDSLSSDYDIRSLETAFSDPFRNADHLAASLESEINHEAPDALVFCGGDSTAWTGVHGLFTASRFRPELRDIPLIFLAYGSGNDVALSLNRGRDLRKILRQGHLIDYQPPKITLTGHNGRTETYYGAGNIGVGVTGQAAKEFNSPQVHDHPHFKSAYRHILLGTSSLKGMIEAQPFVTSEADEQGNFGPEHLIFGRVFFHAMRFGIYGRTRARLSDSFLREGMLTDKYSLKGAGYLGAFILGKAGVKIPTQVVSGSKEFKVRPGDSDQPVYFHLEDSERGITEETIIRVGLAEESAKVYTTKEQA